MPYAAKFLSSDAVKNTKRFIAKAQRKLKGQHATLDIFLRVDDPYSYLLIQAIEPFLARFNVKANFHTVLERQPEMFPAMEMWHEYASRDAAFLAKLYKLSFPSSASTNTHAVHKDPAILEQVTAQLLEAESKPDFIKQALTIFKNVWETPQALANLTVAQNENLNEQLDKKLQQNQELLKSKGHYFGAMIHFEQEWYWGLDRLDHLESRLIKDGLAVNQNEKVTFNLTYKSMCNQVDDLDSTNIDSIGINNTVINSTAIDKTIPLTLYWSARSPYSYIGLERAVKLTQTYNIPLIIKPILPMMMRGLNVPQVKKMYIFLDTKREAQKLGVDYGFVADPLGKAVERCYSLLEYARNENKLQDFLLSFARAVNSQGISAETDKGMKLIVERCGLDWHTAKLALGSTNWKTEVDTNLKEMYQHGCWGVPSFVYSNNVFWGQDRIGIIEQMILKQKRNS
jgi:2-hydroxychromene-2-carboxylate isomerase